MDAERSGQLATASTLTGLGKHLRLLPQVFLLEDYLISSQKSIKIITNMSNIILTVFLCCGMLFLSGSDNKSFAGVTIFIDSPDCSI